MDNHHLLLERDMEQRQFYSYLGVFLMQKLRNLVHKNKHMEMEGVLLGRFFEAF